MIVIKLIVRLPQELEILRQIVALVKEMKNQGLLGDIKIVVEILKLIFQLIPMSKSAALEGLDTLRQKLVDKDVSGLNSLKDNLEKEKKKCEGSFCPADPSDAL